MAFPGPFPQGINPWYVGQQVPTWTPQLIKDNSTPQTIVPLDLTGISGSSIKLHIQPLNSDGTPSGGEVDGAGSVTVTDAANGKITYPPAANDPFVVTAGYYQLQWVVQFAGGPWKSDFFVLQTKAAP